jgi:hypothetical protein
MATDKAMYWLALGVVALGISSAYHNGDLCRVEQAARHAADRGRGLVMMAEVMLGKNPSEMPGLAAALGKVERHAADVPSAVSQRDMAEAQRELAQVSRDLASKQADLARVVSQCSERRIVVNVPNVRIPKVRVPDMNFNPVVDLRGVPGVDFQQFKDVRNLRVNDFVYDQDGPYGPVRVEVHKSHEPI